MLPGVGAFPAAMERLRELGLDECSRERARGRRAGARALPRACSCSSSAPSELGGAEGLGLLRGRGAPLDAEPAAKLPHIGWNEVRFDARLAADRRPAATARAFYHVHSFAPRPAHEEDVLGIGDYGGRFASIVGAATTSSASSSTPRSPRPHGLRAARELRRAAARGPTA